jgi:hypothetical protein
MIADLFQVSALILSIGRAIDAQALPAKLNQEYAPGDGGCV